MWCSKEVSCTDLYISFHIIAGTVKVTCLGDWYCKYQFNWYVRYSNFEIHAEPATCNMPENVPIVKMCNSSLVFYTFSVWWVIVTVVSYRNMASLLSQNVLHYDLSDRGITHCAEAECLALCILSYQHFYQVRLSAVGWLAS